MSESLFQTESISGFSSGVMYLTVKIMFSFCQDPALLICSKVVGEKFLLSFIGEFTQAPALT